MYDLSMKILKDIKPSEEQIINFSGYWIPLQWLYCEMVKNKGIEPLEDIEKNEIKRLKALASNDLQRHKRIWLIQALYVYSQLKG